ncbi:MAG TPA: class I SAM-dependent methyltransferase [Deltaproteobacteria bacterium]|nr:class I SAM-dependent methyltransferase [Deltaproteobacteria bacterium]
MPPSPSTSPAPPGRIERYQHWRDRYAREADRCARYEKSRNGSALKRLSGAFDGRMVRRALRGLAPGSRVLDIPCGGGRISRALRPLDLDVIAADYSIWMLQMLRKHADSPHRGVRADALRLPFRDGAFEASVCFRFMQAVPRALRIRALAELGRVSRRVIVSYPHVTSVRGLRRSLIGRAPRANRVTETEVAREVEAAGLVVSSFEYKVRVFFEDFVVVASPADS